MFALKCPLQNTRRHPVLKQAMKWDQLPDSSFFYSYPLCSRESRSKTTTVMTQKEKVQKLPNEEERLGYLWYLAYAMHQACPNMKKKKVSIPGQSTEKKKRFPGCESECPGRIFLDELMITEG